MSKRRYENISDDQPEKHEDIEGSHDEDSDVKQPFYSNILL